MPIWTYTVEGDETLHEVEADTLAEASAAARKAAGKKVVTSTMLIDQTAALRESTIEKLISGAPMTREEAEALTANIQP